ncbi:uncharacterized protein [Branchiostoma lanceolatum]|uniref:uncharacterized protein n=1 Tax=Branchiostoma lanceolatum TaxID=7740 RepID=UPI0034530B8F
MSRGLALVVLFGLVGAISAQSYKGCYYRQWGVFTFKKSGDDMTNQKCAELCKKDSFPYSGTYYYGKKCSCGKEAEFGGRYPLKTAEESKCSSACAGDPKQKCGQGNGFMSVWNTGYVEPGKRGMAEKLEEVNGRLRELIAKREMAEEMEEIEEQLRELEAKLSR